MSSDKAIIIFKNETTDTCVDVEVPLDITATELVLGLNEAYKLGMDVSDIKKCYLKAENPIVLLKGNQTLLQCGIRNGSVIMYTEQGE